MRTTRRGTKIAALAMGLAIVAAACGSDDKADTPGTEPGTVTTVPGTTAPSTTAGGTDTTTPDGGTEPGGTGAAMTETVEINPDANWSDGTPITVKDFECTWLAHVGTTGSIETTGWDQITSVEAGKSDKEAVISFETVYAPYRGIFGSIIKADEVKDCNNVVDDFDGGLDYSGGPYIIDSWTADQIVYKPNPDYFGPAPVVKKVVVVPQADSDTETASLRSGTVDFIYPQFFDGIQTALADPNIQVDIEYGGDYEALYFQQDPRLKGPFSDRAYREGFSKSIDVDSLFAQIYAPLVDGAEQLTCGAIIPGPYCIDGLFSDTYDPSGAEKALTDGGWVKNSDGFWAKDGTVPEVRWMINTGNTRRESAQNYLIPLLAQAGFKVKADNCEALPCVFETRLPSLDYDLGMYISTAPPDPAYLTPIFTCAQIPSPDNDFKGQNQQGWCNKEASDALEAADKEVDFDKRADLIKTAMQASHDDFVLIPLFQFPKAGAFRTDRLSGPVPDELRNYRAFQNFGEWKDADGDGQIVIGAEQFPVPDCANPITECANSSWYVYVINNPLLPGVYQTTNDGEYAITPLVVGEPVVTIAKG